MSSRKKIVFITRKLNYSGAVRVLWEVIERLDREIFELYVLVDGPKDVAYEEISKWVTKIYFLPAPVKKSLLRGRIKWIQNDRERRDYYLKTIAAIQPDLLYFNTNGNVALLKWSSKLAIPKICHLHGVGEGILYQGYTKSGTPKPVSKERLYITKNVPDYYIACSLACKNVMTQTPYEIEENKIHILPESVELQKVAANEAVAHQIRHQYTTDENTTLIVCVGNFHYRKGPDVLLNAFLNAKQQDKNLELVWVGGEQEKIEVSPFMQKVYKNMQHLKLEESIHFIGHQENVYDYVAAADIFMLCSRDECLPLSILEAMRLKTPVIATDVGGVAEAILHEKTGLLTDSENVDELTRALLRLTKDKQLRKQLAENAYYKVKQQYNVQDHIDKLQILLEDLTSPKDELTLNL